MRGGSHSVPPFREAMPVLTSPRCCKSHLSSPSSVVVDHRGLPSLLTSATTIVGTNNHRLKDGGDTPLPDTPCSSTTSSEKKSEPVKFQLGPDCVDRLRKWLSPLSKEQLIELMAVSCGISQEVFGMCTEAVAQSPAARRLMVRNVSFRTNDDRFSWTLRQFGEIDDCIIVKSRDGRSKGFGFVTYRFMESVTRCLASSVQLDGK